MKKLFCAIAIFGIMNNISYTIENNNSINIQPLEYNTITRYIEQKCEQDNEFKENLNNIINMAQEKYYDICSFLSENKSVINIQDFKFGCDLLEQNVSFFNENISLIFDPNILNLSEQYRKYQIKIDPVIKRIKNCEEKRKILNKELECITQDKKNVSDKIKNMNMDVNEFKNLSISKKDDINNQVNNELFEKLNYIQYKEMTTRKQIVELNNLINILHRENPLNNLGKYDQLFVLYTNKLHIFINFMNKVSLKIHAYNKKHPIYAL